MGDAEKDIHTLMKENRCWDCQSELKPTGEPFTYKCPNVETCGDGEYYSCFLCERENNGHPLSADCDSISKGSRCRRCKKYFCPSCQYDYINCIIDDEYYCEECCPQLPEELKRKHEEQENWFKSFFDPPTLALYNKNKSLLKSWVKQ